MKIKNGFILREVCDDFIVVPVGEAGVDFKSVIKLNETGAFLWGLMGEETTVDNMTASMLDKYDVDEDTARNDILSFCDKLEEAGIIE